MWGYVNPLDVFPAMSAKCPRAGTSRYDCKVQGGCDCGQDDDAFVSFERQNVAAARRPAHWPVSSLVTTALLARDPGDGQD